MRTPLVTNSIRRPGLFTLLLLSPALMSVPGCTDLDETPTSSITPDNFYQNEGEVIAGLAAVYAQLRNTLWSYYNLSEVSSDEMIVPTRGQDWYDNGRWLELHRQSWAANSPSGLDDINGGWNDAYQGVARANVLLEALENVTVANKTVIVAELRTLRAFYYYILMDLFGGVPIDTTADIEALPRSTRAELFAFIEAQLNAARQDLPVGPAASYGRLRQGAADAILANMYLNAEVFTGTVTAGGLQKGQARWQDAITAADRILNSGAYSLASNWRSNFTAANSGSPENILVVTHLNQDGLGLNFIMRSLHYAQFNPSPWNGFATIAETYNAFDADDQRRQMWLVGQQVNVETNQVVNDRQGNPLVFTVTIADATQATEGEGARPYKFPADPSHVAQENGNDFPYFRLGEIYLIKAEASFELGNTGQALTLLNTLRARVFEPDEPLAAVDRDVILRERLFELAAEAKRRQDLIRHGKFTQAWSFKPQTAAFRILMPIPQTQMDANPQLTQNAGY